MKLVDSGLVIASSRGEAEGERRYLWETKEEERERERKIGNGTERRRTEGGKSIERGWRVRPRWKMKAQKFRP